tara:strand:- start:1367 stop:1825 length:459 start_codon:yes stop_codon:yes gene_type:complete
MSDIDYEESYDEENENEFFDDEEFDDENGENQFEVDDDDGDENILNVSQFSNKNDYENILTIQNQIEDNSDKRTRDRITKYECTKLIGFRAQQLSLGMPSFIDTKNYNNVIDIAIAEYLENKIPYIIRRPLPDGKYEYWKVQDLKRNNNLNL